MYYCTHLYVQEEKFELETPRRNPKILAAPHFSLTEENFPLTEENLHLTKHR